MQYLLFLLIMGAIGFVLEVLADAVNRWRARSKRRLLQAEEKAFGAQRPLDEE